LGAYYHLARERGNKAKSDSKRMGEAYQWLKDCGKELECLKKRDRDAIDRIERLARSSKPHKLNSLASSMKEFSGKRFEKYLREGAPPEIYEVFCGPSVAIVSGNPFIVIDNFRGALKSAILESSLKGTGSVEIRVPHHGGAQIQTRYINWLLSSNGVQGGPDFANRVIVTRILKQPTGYVFKAWGEGDVLAHIKANQSSVLGAIFAVVMEWDKRGQRKRPSYARRLKKAEGIRENLLREFHIANIKKTHIDKRCSLNVLVRASLSERVCSADLWCDRAVMSARLRSSTRSPWSSWLRTPAWPPRLRRSRRAAWLHPHRLP
jgi:hypothetical protein